MTTNLLQENQVVSQYRCTTTKRKSHQKETIMNRSTANRSFRRRGLAGMLFLALVGVAGNANAQWAVVDAPHTAINQFAWIEQYRQELESLQRQYNQIMNQKKQIEQFTSKIVNYQNMTGVRVDLTKRDLNAGLENCDRFGGPKDGGLTSTLSGVVPSLNSLLSDVGLGSKAQSYQEVLELQETNCQRMELAKNLRYNMAVEVLQTTKKYDEQLEGVAESMSDVAGEQSATFERERAQLDRIQTGLTADYQAATAMIAAYGAAITTLNDEQTQLAQRAYKVKGGLAGQIVQYGTLKLALQAARQRDR